MYRHALYTPLLLLNALGLVGGTAAAVTASAPAGTRRPPVVVTEPVRTPAPRVAHPAARPSPQSATPARVVVRPEPAAVVSPRRHRPATTPPRRRPETLAQAIARIPGYHAGEARWVVTRKYGHWGVSDIYRGTVYISPAVPSRRLYDVVSHEWSHILSVKVYGGDVDRALAAMNAHFGGTGLQGAERAADCMARVLGARWTYYTPCTSPRWRAGARQLLARRPL